MRRNLGRNTSFRVLLQLFSPLTRDIQPEKSGKIKREIRKNLAHGVCTGLEGGEGGEVGGVSPRVSTLCSAANLSTSWTFECLSAGNSGEILLAASDFTVYEQT